MPIVIALILGVALLVVVLVNLIWALILLVPIYAYIAVAIYLVMRNRRRQAETDAFIAREAERQRVLNDQEFQAWKAAAEGAKRNASKRDRALRRFDNERDPPTS